MMPLIRVIRIALLALWLLSYAPAFASPGSSDLTVDQATQMLKDGNQRFASHQMKFPDESRERMQEVVAGQKPSATVLDDLFVIRVAGNVADIDEIGTVEHGIGHLETQRGMRVLLGADKQEGHMTLECSDHKIGHRRLILWQRRVA
jgi:hypothetical protein